VTTTRTARIPIASLSRADGHHPRWLALPPVVRLCSISCAARLHQGQYEAARTQAQKSLTLTREVGRRLHVRHALRLPGSVALAEGAYAGARGWFQESLAV
jgi:hypothetical protein